MQLLLRENPTTCSYMLFCFLDGIFNEIISQTLLRNKKNIMNLRAMQFCYTKLPISCFYIIFCFLNDIFNEIMPQTCIPQLIVI